VLIHDPQPAALIEHFPQRRNKWIWRCHIDVSGPRAPSGNTCARSSASTTPACRRCRNSPSRSGTRRHHRAEHRSAEARRTCRSIRSRWRARAARFGIDPERPLVLQVSRFDRFKDPLGVVKAFRMVRPHFPVQLALAGGTADDDPRRGGAGRRHGTGRRRSRRARARPAGGRAPHHQPRSSGGPTWSCRSRCARGFGLTVTEAMWKGKPVIGGDTAEFGSRS